MAAGQLERSEMMPNGRIKTIFTVHITVRFAVHRGSIRFSHLGSGQIPRPVRQIAPAGVLILYRPNYRPFIVQRVPNSAFSATRACLST